MEAMTAQQFGAYTEDDLEAFRATDERLRFELIDGELFVTPSPRMEHQLASSRLSHILMNAAPPHLQVFTAPLDVRLARDTVIQPDLLVVPWSNLNTEDADLEPVLAVEILSPSSRRADLSRKKIRLARAACPAYWVVDPDVPSLLVWELRGRAYDLVAEVSGDHEARLTRPFPVAVTPAALVSRP